MHLFALLLGVATAALATMLLGGIFLPRERLFPYGREVGLATLALLCIFALREVSFLRKVFISIPPLTKGPATAL